MDFEGNCISGSSTSVRAGIRSSVFFIRSFRHSAFALTSSLDTNLDFDLAFNKRAKRKRISKTEAIEATQNQIEFGCDSVTACFTASGIELVLLVVVLLSGTAMQSGWYPMLSNGQVMVNKSFIKLASIPIVDGI